MKKQVRDFSLAKLETLKQILMYRWMLPLYSFSTLAEFLRHIFTHTGHWDITTPCLCKCVTWTCWMGAHNGVYWIVSSFLSRLCFLPSYPSLQISGRFSLMCAHKHRGISPPFFFPSIPCLCLEWQFNNYPLSVTNLFIYLFVCFGLGGWDPHRRSVFGILAVEESNPSNGGYFSVAFTASQQLKHQDTVIFNLPVCLYKWGYSIYYKKEPSLLFC